MALADILRERVSRRGRTAQVDCGELGTVTVEALSPRECASLGMADGGRALLYAACRELQAAGEALRRERRLFTPDEVTQYVSDSEARTAARTVLALSGVTLDETDSPDEAENRLESVQESGKDFPEVRLQSVQSPDSLPREAPETRENRLGTVQESGKQFSEIRPGIVQFPEDAPEDGQVSREFSGDAGLTGETPSVGAVSDFEPQNLALSEKNDGFMSPLELSEENVEVSGQMTEMHESELEAGESPHEIKSEFPKETAVALHETESEVPGSLHETESEVEGQEPSPLHETTSELPESAHESKSEFPADGRQALHEMKSELRQPLHETKSDFREGLHETKSDFREGLHETKSEVDENRREGLHETTSELAEQVAARLLEGLRRAAAVR